MLLLPQSEPGGNCKMPSGRGVGGALARDGPQGLVLVAGTIAPLASGAASVTFGLQLVSSHIVNNILAALCWPWV